ncbi:TIM barrel protein [bacterium]|nr:TIM barrel protein [bacterium]
MAGAAAVGAFGLAGAARAEKAKRKPRAVTSGRINQSIVYWCFEEYWDVEKACQVAKQLGCKSVELVEPESWPTLKKYGIVCALTPSHLFVRGVNNPLHWEECLGKMKKAIDVTAEAGFKSVITFTGYADTSGEEKGSKVDPDEGTKNCIKAYKKIIGYAEKKKVNLCLEQLNTRDRSHPMKGHPGYQGDHVDYCMEIIKKVGSPNMKLLFDVYHVQVMDGDLVRRIKECGEYIGHIHAAGNPGRGELDEKQEINYPAVMQALLDIGYKGYVGQEFIPTRDPLDSLAEAVKVCDV